MNTSIQKATSRGQITLPAKWRKQFNTDNYLMEVSEGFLKIKPIDVEELVDEEVIFDADRDNNGKGVLAKDLVKILASING